MLTVHHRAGLDAHGNPTSGDRESIARYDRALGDLLRYHPTVVEQAVGLVTEAPELAMGHVLVAYLSLSSTDAADLPGAREAANALAALPRNEREEAHRSAIEAWLAGDMHRAARLLDELLLRWPADLLALLFGHQLDFFVGDAANLRDRIGRSRFALDPDHPHLGYVLGMQAFGLEECGHYAEAEDAGMAAIERHADDVWAIHAVAHTLEMRGMVDRGIRFLRDRQGDWGAGNLFTVHNWWHLGLFLLEAGRTDDVLAIYDTEVHPAGAPGIPLELVDASAMLWRLRLDGVPTGDRFDEVADAWAASQANGPTYAFNDVHAAMAFAGAGRLAEARATVDRLVVAANGADGWIANEVMAGEVGLPVALGIVAWAEGRYAEAVRVLAPVRTRSARFGGSHAQRDVIQRTLLDSALRDGQLDLAQALLSERLAVRSSSTYGWTNQARLWRQRGDDGGWPALAEAADRQAAGHRSRFDAAAAAS